jgi:dGTPase
MSFDLAPYASSPASSRGRLVPQPESALRSPFQRDRDRIIHSGAFRKLKNKTQVFINTDGDYYRTRLTHSLEVAQIARTIARVLRLDEDLTETQALAHDLGHTCFGHAGEDALDEAMQPYGGFSHNDQTLRILTFLERRYLEFDGLNLTWETLEGVVKHNGPLLPEKPGHALTTTIREFQQKWDLELDRWPSLEAQVAALSDDIAYNTHDIDDGWRAGLFSIAELIEQPLFGPALRDIQAKYPGASDSHLMADAVRRVIGELVHNLLAETCRRLDQLKIGHVDDVRAAGQGIVGFDEKAEAEINGLRRFLKERMYRHYEINRMTSKGRRVVRDLFAHFLAEPNCLPTEWFQHIQSDTPQQIQARIIADYIAGMTDRYAITEYNRLFHFEKAL